MWDAESGDIIWQPIESHTSSVESVVFSRKDTCVISVSNEDIVWMWEVIPFRLYFKVTHPSRSHPTASASLRIPITMIEFVYGIQRQEISLEDLSYATLVL